MAEALAKVTALLAEKNDGNKSTDNKRGDVGGRGDRGGRGRDGSSGRGNNNFELDWRKYNKYCFS